MGPAVQGQGGDHHTYRAACVLVRDFGLPFEGALDAFREWNAGCVPPWKDRDLVRKLRSASKGGRHEVSHRLREAPRWGPNADSAYDYALEALFTFAPPKVVLGELAVLDARLKYPRPMRRAPDAERWAALYLALYSPGRVERGPGRVAWLTDEAKRQFFICNPGYGVSTKEKPYSPEDLGTIIAAREEAGAPGWADEDGPWSGQLPPADPESSSPSRRSSARCWSRATWTP
jgi:hypothetical protein